MRRRFIRVSDIATIAATRTKRIVQVPIVGYELNDVEDVNEDSDFFSDTV